MGKKVAYKSLITNPNTEMAGFEWLPDLEGIKTFLSCELSCTYWFEWLPDLEGIKTRLHLLHGLLLRLNGCLI